TFPPGHPDLLSGQPRSFACRGRLRADRGPREEGVGWPKQSSMRLCAESRQPILGGILLLLSEATMIRSSRRSYFSTCSRPPFRLRSRALRVEELEPRTLLSTAGLDQLVATPAGSLVPLVNNSSYGNAYTPQQIRQVYGFDNILFNGIKGDG